MLLLYHLQRHRQARANIVCGNLVRKLPMDQLVIVAMRTPALCQATSQVACGAMLLHDSSMHCAVHIPRVQQALRIWQGPPGSGPGHARWRPMKAM